MSNKLKRLLFQLQGYKFGGFIYSKISLHETPLLLLLKQQKL